MLFAIGERSAFGITRQKDFLNPVNPGHTANILLKAVDFVFQVQHAPEKFGIQHEEERTVADWRRRIRIRTLAPG